MTWPSSEKFMPIVGNTLEYQTELILTNHPYVSSKYKLDMKD